MASLPNYGFNQIVEQVINSSEFQIDSDCNFLIQEFIMSGTTYLYKEYTPDSPEFNEALDEAQNFIINFVERMIDEEKMKNSTTIDRITFLKVKDYFCPCRPFC